MYFKVCLYLFLSVILLPGYGQTVNPGSLVGSAIALTRQEVQYDPAYFSIPYPMGDIPEGKGVCTDVIIRAYRGVGIDLQQKVHEDMRDHFAEYPDLWGLDRTDTNIDHRRVPNLMKFFERHGTVKIISRDPGDYSPGDIICWNLGGGTTHTGILSDRRSRDGKRFLVVHNIGDGQVLEDMMFDYVIIGHYSYGLSPTP